MSHTTKKILILSPYYSAKGGGLGGYSLHFASKLAESFQLCVVCNWGEHTEEFQPNTEIYRVGPAWGIKSFVQITAKILAFGPDHVLIQYVPFMYSPRGGINLWLVLFAWVWRLMGVKCNSMLHELYYPFQWHPKAIVMHVFHKLMLIGLLMLSRKIYVSTNAFFDILKGVFASLCNDKVEVLPVSSNICGAPVERANARRRYGAISEEDRVVVLFGSMHPSKNYRLVFKALENSVMRGVPVKILFIGQDESMILPVLPENLQDRIICMGKVADSEVINALCAGDLMVSYFVDGISTRRGSALAAIKYGLPLVTTRTESSDSYFFDLDAIVLLDTIDKVFVDQLTETLANWNLIAPNEELKALYHKYFSWEMIVQSYRKSAFS